MMALSKVKVFINIIFILSSENSEFAASRWATTDKRMLDPTKNIHPTSKGKEEAPARW